jgi:hypothetical protein
VSVDQHVGVIAISGKFFRRRMCCNQYDIYVCDRKVESLLKLSPHERGIHAESIEATANLLSSVHSLRSLSKESLLDMTKHCVCKIFKYGSKVIRQGDDDHTM